MSLPNLPLKRTNDFDRRVAETVNYLLNRELFMVVKADGVPSASQVLVDEEFPVPVTVIARDCAIKADTVPTNDATFSMTIGGVSAGTATILSGDDTGAYSFTITEVPAFTRLSIVAPATPDPTMAGIRFFIALSH